MREESLDWSDDYAPFRFYACTQLEASVDQEEKKKKQQAVKVIVQGYRSSPRAFLNSIKHGNLDNVRQYVARHLHTRGDQGRTAIHTAALHDQFEILKLLVFRGANLSDRDEAGWSVLHFTAQNGNLDAVKFLLTQQADPDVVEEFGLRPIDVAALNSHVDVVRVLHLHGSDLNYSSLDGRTNLHHAIASTGEGADQVIDYLLAQEIDLEATDNFGWTPLHTAVQKGNNSVVEKLLLRGADVNRVTKMDYGDLNSVRVETPLHLAVERENLDIVRLLLNIPGVQVNVVNHFGQAALSRAVSLDSYELVEMLINAGAKINSLDLDYQTPLFIASWIGSERLVKLLLEHGATVDFMTRCGDTPLSIASSQNIRAVLQLYQCSQHYHERCLALAKKPGKSLALQELMALIPLITSVYDLRMLLTLASTMDDALEQRRPSQVVDLVQTAFEHILVSKLVLDDRACVFFRLVLKHCFNTKLLSENEYMLWDLQSGKVNMESAEWVVELNKQVYRNSWRLDVNEQQFSLMVNGMKEIHAAVLNNRDMIGQVTTRARALQQQVDEGKKICARLISHGQALSDQVNAFQRRLERTESSIMVVASSFNTFRTTYVRRLEQEKKQRLLKMGCGIITSLAGFVFAPALNQVFDALIDLASPIEIFNHIYTESDVVDFLAESTMDNALLPYLQEQLDNCVIPTEEFENVLRKEIMLQNPELVTVCQERGLNAPLEYGDVGDVHGLISTLSAEEEQMLRTLEELGDVVSVSHTKATTFACVTPIVNRHSTNTELLQKLSPKHPDQKNCEHPKDVHKQLTISSNQHGEDIEFADDIQSFPCHYAIHSSEGDLSSFLELTEVIDDTEYAPDAVMTLYLTKKSTSCESICAAEYAYLVGYPAIGDFLAAKMNGLSTTLTKYSPSSITLLEDVHKFAYVHAVHDSHGNMDECQFLLDVVDDEDDIDAQIKVEIVHNHETETVSWSAVEYACHLGYVDIVRHLLKKHVKTSVPKIVMLQRAREQAKILGRV